MEKWMKVKYDEMIEKNKICTLQLIQDLPKIISLAEKEKKEKKNKKKTMLLIIDMQNDFMEQIGELPIRGSKGDIERLTKWIYKNIEGISQIMCSLDTHAINQIFYSCWWKNKTGQNPDPYTKITYQDVINENWIPLYETEKSLEYIKSLYKNGKKELIIWPYHCLDGSIGANLEGQLTKMIYFHSAFHNTAPTFIRKGSDPCTEMYGIIKGEDNSSHTENIQVLENIKIFDNIYIAGEASSHCVLETIKQILEYFENENSVYQKINILEDCMSPVTGFEELTKNEFKKLEEKYHINMIKSTECNLL